MQIGRLSPSTQQRTKKKKIRCITHHLCRCIIILTESFICCPSLCVFVCDKGCVFLSIHTGSTLSLTYLIICVYFSVLCLSCGHVFVKRKLVYNTQTQREFDLCGLCAHLLSYLKPLWKNGLNWVKQYSQIIKIDCGHTHFPHMTLFIYSFFQHEVLLSVRISTLQSDFQVFQELSLISIWYQMQEINISKHKCLWLTAPLYGLTVNINYFVLHVKFIKFWHRILQSIPVNTLCAKCTAIKLPNNFDSWL